VTNVHGHGTWRCVCVGYGTHPGDYVKGVINHVVELAKGNLHLLSRAVQAGLGASDLEPPQLSGTETVDEQCAWYVELCV